MPKQNYLMMTYVIYLIISSIIILFEQINTSTYVGRFLEYHETRNLPIFEMTSLRDTVHVYSSQ